MPSSAPRAVHPLSKQPRAVASPRLSRPAPSIRRKPNRTTLAYRPDPAAGPAADSAAVETTQRIPVTGTSAQQRPASAYAPDSPQGPAPKKSATGPLIAVIVVLVAIIIALVIFFVIKPFDNAATQTTAEVTKLHHDDDADDLKPLGDPNSLYDDDDDDEDEAGGEATLSRKTSTAA